SDGRKLAHHLPKTLVNIFFPERVSHAVHEHKIRHTEESNRATYPSTSAPPSSLTLSLPPANSISSSASLISSDSTVVPPSRAMLAYAMRRISSLMNAGVTPFRRSA